jgi:DNA-binding response OmpR family regulator
MYIYFCIGMSANSDNATKQCALDAGMDKFICKPFIFEQLQPLIKQVTMYKVDKTNN